MLEGQGARRCTMLAKWFCPILCITSLVAPAPVSSQSPLLDDVGLPTVKGSGTITARGLMNDYFKNLTAKSNTPVVYVYDAVGDTQGQENFVAETYDFVVSDMALLPAQLRACNRPVLQIPFAINALGAAHTLPGVKNGQLYLDAQTLAGIFQCNITRWNDAAIVALNPNLTLPAETIRPVARADRATTTWLLSSYLDSMGVGWVLGVAKAVNWPPCVHRVKGVADLLSYMGNTTYAAGMVQHVLAENQQTAYATLRNQAGAWVLPSTADYSNLGSELAFPTTVASPNWVNVSMSKSASAQAYPLAGLEFIIVNQFSKYMGFPEGNLLRYLAFNMLSPQFQALLPAYRFSKVPPQLMTLISNAKLMVTAANSSDTGLDANGDPILAPAPSPVASAAAGTAGFKWWMGLIIAVIVALVLTLSLIGLLFWWHRRWRRRAAAQAQDQTGSGISPIKPCAELNGRGMPESSGSSRCGSGRKAGGDEGDLTPSTQDIVLAPSRTDSLKSEACSRSGASGPASHNAPSSRGTPVTVASGGTGSRSMSGLESSLMSIEHLLRHRSDTGLEALEIGALIGRGSFGRVYKGRWRGGTVAVKVITHDKHVGNNFDALRESVLSTNIQHPNVVMTYKVHTLMHSQTDTQHRSTAPAPGGKGSGGEAELATSALASAAEDDPADQLLETWMLLEYCDQGNLEAASREARFKDDYATIYLCLMDIASGMDYLHSLGVLHGDVKGANVLLRTTAPTAYDPRGFVCKMADFGLSRVLESDATHVSTFTYGTAAYMAPELLQKGKMTRAADVYSFAMIMVELFTCKRLFDGLSQQQIMYQVFSGKKPPVERQGMPRDYDQLIQDCWNDDPQKRPTFSAILSRLKQMFDNERRRLFMLQQQDQSNIDAAHS